MKRKIKKRTVYVKMYNPSGRSSVKGIKVRSKSLRGIQMEYLGSSEHQRTEAYPTAIVSKPRRKRRKSSYLQLPRGFR